MEDKEIVRHCHELKSQFELSRIISPVKVISDRSFIKEMPG